MIAGERIVSALLSSHRVGFTVGAALLGVGGSVVATDPRSVATWCLFLGSALLMFVEDGFADHERDARTLARGSNKPLSTIRYDVFRDHHAARQSVLLCLAVALMLGWGAARLLESSGDKAAKDVAPSSTKAPSVTPSATGSPPPSTPTPPEPTKRKRKRGR